MTLRTWLSSWLVAVSSLVLLEGDASAQQAPGPGPFGLGVVIGAPTGVTVKGRLGQTSSVDGAFGLGVGADVHVHGDYLFEGLPVILKDAESGITLDWYLGVGARMLLVDDNDRNGKDDDDLEFGPRAPIGLEMYLSSVPNMELFLELAIGLDLVDETGITADGGLGFRWFF